MATIDIYNLSGAKAGPWNWPKKFSARSTKTCSGKRLRTIAPRRARVRMPPRTAGAFPFRQEAVEAEGHGRRVSARSVRHCGVTAAPSTDRSRVPTTTPSEEKLLGALRSALASKFADGKLVVVKAFDVKEPKTKLFAKRSTN